MWMKQFSKLDCFGTWVCETRVLTQNWVSQTRFTLGFIWLGLKKRKKTSGTRVPWSYFFSCLELESSKLEFLAVILFYLFLNGTQAYYTRVPCCCCCCWFFFFQSRSDEFKSKSSLGNSILGWNSSFTNLSSKNSPTN